MSEEINALVYCDFHCWIFSISIVIIVFIIMYYFENYFKKKGNDTK